ncbi:MAG: hypothetical protein NTX14_00335 [Candidatus Nealsonbacteria bacterium]|nr:hypothetical protein [Candidatus Nealsonbacteria bacterium]
MSKAYRMLSKHPNCIYLQLVGQPHEIKDLLRKLGSNIFDFELFDKGRLPDNEDELIKLIGSLSENEVLVALGSTLGTYGNNGSDFCAIVIRTPLDWGFFRDSLAPSIVARVNIAVLKKYLKESDFV